MVEPVSLTGAALVTLAASKFVETAAEKAAAQLGTGVTAAVLKKAGTQVDAMWARVKRHFAGNKKAEGAIAQVEAGPPESPQSEAAVTKLGVYLDDDLAEPENQVLAGELRQMAQQIVNIGQQQQTTTTFNIDARDESRVNAIGGDVNATTVNFGDGQR